MFVRKTNAIYCKIMTHQSWTKYLATCNTVECFGELLKISQLPSALWFFTLMWRVFFP